MPAKPRRKKLSYDRKRAMSKPSPSTTQTPTAEAVETFTPSVAVKPRANTTTPKTIMPSYVNVGRELKRTAIVTGVVLVILVILFVFLR